MAPARSLPSDSQGRPSGRPAQADGARAAQPATSRPAKPGASAPSRQSGAGTGPNPAQQAENAARQILALQAELAQQRELVTALTTQLEDAAVQLDRWHRRGMQPQGERRVSDEPAETVVVNALPPELVADLERVIAEWDQLQAATAIDFLAAQIAELRELVLTRLVDPAELQTTIEQALLSFAQSHAAPAEPSYTHNEQEFAGDEAYDDFTDEDTDAPRPTYPADITSEAEDWPPAEDTLDEFRGLDPADEMQDQPAVDAAPDDFEEHGESSANEEYALEEYAVEAAVETDADEWTEDVDADSFTDAPDESNAADLAESELIDEAAELEEFADDPPPEEEDFEEIAPELLEAPAEPAEPEAPAAPPERPQPVASAAPAAPAAPVAPVRSWRDAVYEALEQRGNESRSALEVFSSYSPPPPPPPVEELREAEDGADEPPDADASADSTTDDEFFPDIDAINEIAQRIDASNRGAEPPMPTSASEPRRPNRPADAAPPAAPARRPDAAAPAREAAPTARRPQASVAAARAPIQSRDENDPGEPRPVDFAAATTEDLHAAIDERDAYIAYLIQRLRAAESVPPEAWDAILQAGTAQQRAAVEELATQLDEKLRLAEIEMSMERARIGREQNKLAAMQESLDKQMRRLGLKGDSATPGNAAAAARDPERRWNRFLGKPGK